MPSGDARAPGFTAIPGAKLRAQQRATSTFIYWRFGLGMLFLQRDAEARVQAELTPLASDAGMPVPGSGKVPTNNLVLVRAHARPRPYLAMRLLRRSAR